MVEKPVNVRCGWLNKDPLYINYHDHEWGVPEYNSYKLFEMICLEGQQAGLSWITILKKRENYRKVFFNFIPNKIVDITDADVDFLLIGSNESGLIRHKGKIEAILNNAKCFIAMENNNEDFSKFIWSFVEGKPIVNLWKNDAEVPAESEISKNLSKELKKRKFKFVGPKICYAFMQACGLVNDHIIKCVCRKTTA